MLMCHMFEQLLLLTDPHVCLLPHALSSLPFSWQSESVAVSWPLNEYLENQKMLTSHFFKTMESFLNFVWCMMVLFFRKGCTGWSFCLNMLSQTSIQMYIYSIDFHQNKSCQYLTKRKDLPSRPQYIWKTASGPLVPD